MSTNTAVILDLQHVSKQFPGVLALQDVTLALHVGEVHALLGENGAGKSTLTKIIAGVYPPTSGEIRLFGEPCQFAAPHDAQKAGIGVLYQEFNLLPELSVAENVFLGSEPEQHGLPVIDWKGMHQRTRDLLERLGTSISPDATVGNLSVAQQQMVQVVKALHQNAKLIVMDEPTTRLTEFEARDLFAVVRALKREGVTIIFISHRLEEVKQICDRATILRDGEVVATVDVASTSLETLAALMLGHRLAQRFPPRHMHQGDELLRVQGLTRYGAFEDIDFALYGGEILGITGLVGSGRTALLRAIFGIIPVDEGHFYVDRRLAQIHSPQDAIAHGIGLLTEDRQREGLVLEMGIGENITLASLEHDPPGLLIDHQHEAELTDYFIRELRISTPHPDFQTRYLSGGTQQKIVISKWLATGPRILLCDEPTQGVDIGAKVEIYRLMNDLVENGLGIVMVSADISEVLGMCDRLIVLRDGQIVARLARGEASESTVLAYAMGETPDA
ncbi:MAG TPA: sugar ABC transporter ATP-binding protein [Aggregatilinea sp.]|uniref:sugar ABC transporter ATP-binding protein n=1 Tax=Aggregatilinea sp. TaxID=2806333 RepID=UPI002CA6B6E1|nr:sugar ABC transporter ATP-binding protein [Aggregatilinea sp.]HML23470.1 sugar ABC transporter ATP-binding protein [Aggregatilinea sp.]